ncbi:valyl tRNA synthetase modifier [Acinetobacter phage Acj9]|uniref:Vs valyl-tRNA synthetase modifier n=1 Tax=Acinetobacter phage Acj9 TaxID=760939 RepID=E5EPS1_9CAUD|nr:valyl tRNA synthetase modifier [Acinetobacter phage Acj9]ADG60037.1 Vs valyl-tRNA synthetase modifier [Acinetobacter phage Acj9]
MKPFALILAMLLASPFSFAESIEDLRTTQAAEFVCLTDKECVDLVSLQLDGMYYEGLNERDPASIGTLINRKARSLRTFCHHAPDKRLCETYKNKLMLKYMTGLLDR